MAVSPAATQLFAVRRALVALLQLRPNLAGVLVTYGWPGDSRAQRQMIYTDARADGDQAPASIKPGRMFVRETARLDVTIRVEAVGGNAEDADRTTEDLSLELAQAVADNNTLDGLVQWIRPLRWVSLSGYNDNGYASLLTYTYEYDAKLT